MTQRTRKAIATILMFVGGGLIVLEVWGIRNNGGFEGWFWLVIGALTVVFGLAELLAPAPAERDRHNAPRRD